MNTLSALLTLVAVPVLTVHAYSSFDTDLLANESYAQLGVRQEIPEVPPKPPTSGPGSFHGSQFNFLEQTGFAPAVDAMPAPCAPEGGTNAKGDGPNPGTNVGISASPGEDCKNVGPNPKRPYTLANAFPTYVSASWCGNLDEWRIQYFNYYVHDGILSIQGHRHDWEGIVVKWKRDPEGDWWHRTGAIYNKHCFHDNYRWDELNTVDVYVIHSFDTLAHLRDFSADIQLISFYSDLPGITLDPEIPSTTDVSEEATGLNRKHPKVYVGFFSHASYPEINRSRKTNFNGPCPAFRDVLGNEYR
ncbi:MAG: hypothetical protein Q9196_004926 [Gyalolechia fulgens]